MLAVSLYSRIVKTLCAAFYGREKKEKILSIKLAVGGNVFIRVYKSLLFLSIISMTCLWGTNSAGYGGQMVQGMGTNSAGYGGQIVHGMGDSVDSVSPLLYNTIEVIRL